MLGKYQITNKAYSILLDNVVLSFSHAKEVENGAKMATALY
jgi:hypothetical protein